MLKHIIIGLLAVCACIFFANIPHLSPNQFKILTETSPQDLPQGLKFHNPALANKILQKLDVFSEVSLDDVDRSLYNAAFLGLLPNHNYCRAHRTEFTEHPEIAFSQKNFITEFWSFHQLRTHAIPMIDGDDLHKEVGYDITPRTPGLQTNYKMRTDANMFFTNRAFFRYRKIGRQYSCLTQISNHVPGSIKVLRKNEVGQVVSEYAKKFIGKEELCFDERKFIPKTWVLSEKDQCEAFFKEFNSEYYKALKQERGVVYLRKIAVGVHQGQGVFPVTETEEENLKIQYQNGSLCGQDNSSTLIQYMIHNPLLLEGRKFDFRVYMLVASTNPMITYSYDGYLRVSLTEYDSKSDNKNTFVTNIVLNSNAFALADKKGKYKGMTKEEMHEKTCWWFEDLQEYLIKEGKIVNPEWLESYLRPQMNKVMIHVARMLELNLVKQSSLSELYGIDLMMDENLDLWFIELNTMPLLHGWTEKTTEFFNKMLVDYFDIVFGLLRSRVKRIVAYVNDMIEKEHYLMKDDGDVKIEDLKVRRKEFREISKNYFEPEFVMSQENKFRLIVDNNLDGAERYNGNLHDDCV